MSVTKKIGVVFQNLVYSKLSTGYRVFLLIMFTVLLFCLPDNVAVAQGSDLPLYFFTEIHIDDFSLQKKLDKDVFP